MSFLAGSGWVLFPCVILNKAKLAENPGDNSTTSSRRRNFEKSEIDAEPEDVTSVMGFQV